MIFKKLINLWFEKNKRIFPWRENQNPYHILVSELMLQQTQSQRVVEFFNNWIKAFKTEKDLAKSDIKTILKHWSGLGYNRRALQLFEISKIIEKNGFPISSNEWMQLKGIGPYTSKAIACFTKKERILPIDTNIRRVLGRFFLKLPYPKISDDFEIAKLQTSLFKNETDPSWIVQSLFDLGALVCKPKPNCQNCPLQKHCKISKMFINPSFKKEKNLSIKKEYIHPNKKYPDRIYRGKILKLIQNSKNGCKIEDVFKIDTSFQKEKDERWILNILARLEKDGFIEKRKNNYLIKNTQAQ